MEMMESLLFMRIHTELLYQGLAVVALEMLNNGPGAIETLFASPYLTTSFYCSSSRYPY